jgi:hypothetical protein
MPADNPAALVPRHELLAIVIAALVLLIVLVASYMCLVLYGEKSAGPCPPSAGPGQEGFLGNFSYNPVCGGSYCDSFRKNCHGFTSGAMPAIESEWSGGGLCPGLFTDGVPP